MYHLPGTHMTLVQPLYHLRRPSLSHRRCCSLHGSAPNLPINLHPLNGKTQHRMSREERPSAPCLTIQQVTWRTLTTTYYEHFAISTYVMLPMTLKLQLTAPNYQCGVPLLLDRIKQSMASCRVSVSTSDSWYTLYLQGHRKRLYSLRSEQA